MGDEDTSNFECPPPPPPNEYGLVDPHSKYPNENDCGSFFVCHNNISRGSRAARSAPSTTLSQRAATRPRMCQSAKTTIPTWRASWTRRMPEEESRLKPSERQTHMLSNYI